MERQGQDHGEAVQFADVQVISRYGAHLAVPHRRQAGGGATAPRPGGEHHGGRRARRGKVVIPQSLGISLGLA